MKGGRVVVSMILISYTALPVELLRDVEVSKIEAMYVDPTYESLQTCLSLHGDAGWRNVLVPGFPEIPVRW